jgi:hypothetical protein
MKTFLVFLLLFTTVFAFAQITKEMLLGKWSYQYMTYEGQLVNGGTIIFFEDSHCQITVLKSSSKDYDFSIKDNLVFIRDFGYYYEIPDKTRIKLIPGFDADVKYLLLTKAEK